MNASKRLEELESEMQKLRDEARDIKQKYTFRGFYSLFAGKNSILRPIIKEEGKTDIEKISIAIEKIRDTVDTYEEELNADDEAEE